MDIRQGAWVSLYRHLGSPRENPMGVEWFGLVMGLGFVLSFGYWCTDFLVIQRAMAARTMGAARRTPLIAAVPKMIFPFIIIVPGMVAMALTYTAMHGGGGPGAYLLPTLPDGTPDYNMAIPTLLGHYFPSGMLGIGLTALMASFMSGMAGNVTAFNTVWTYDIYESYIRPGQSDQHYLNMGRFATVFGIAASMGAAYLAAKFNNIMDLLQLVFAFVNAPLFATFLLGMFWRRSTGHGGVLRTARGDAGGGGTPRRHAAGRVANRRQGRVAHQARGSHLSQRNGPGFLDGNMGVLCLLCGDCDRFAGHTADQVG